MLCLGHLRNSVQRKGAASQHCSFHCYDLLLHPQLAVGRTRTMSQHGSPSTVLDIASLQALAIDGQVEHAPGSAAETSGDAHATIVSAHQTRNSRKRRSGVKERQRAERRENRLGEVLYKPPRAFFPLWVLGCSTRLGLSTRPVLRPKSPATRRMSRRASMPDRTDTSCVSCRRQQGGMRIWETPPQAQQAQQRQGPKGPVQRGPTRRRPLAHTQQVML